jgi:hypothetical protein
MLRLMISGLIDLIRLGCTRSILAATCRTGSYIITTPRPRCTYRLPIQMSRVVIRNSSLGLKLDSSQYCRLSIDYPEYHGIISRKLIEFRI